MQELNEMYEQVTGLERNIGKLMVHNGSWSHGSCVKGPYHGSVCPWPYKTAVYMGYARDTAVYMGYARQLCIWAMLDSCVYGWGILDSCVYRLFVPPQLSWRVVRESCRNIRRNCSDE